MFRQQLMESVNVFAVGKIHFSRSGSDSLDKTAVQWKVCHAGSDRLHTTQPFLSDCHFLAVLYTIRQVAHIQYDLGALSQHMPCRYISCKQLWSVSAYIHACAHRILWTSRIILTSGTYLRNRLLKWDLAHIFQAINIKLYLEWVQDFIQLLCSLEKKEVHFSKSTYFWNNIL